jgi:alanine racemase
MELNDRCWVDINTSAFVANVEQARTTLAGEAQLMVAVKSEAYGHGGQAMAQLAVAAGADALAVLDIPTGVDLRASAPDIPMLCWLISPHSNVADAVTHSLTLGISHLWQLDMIRKLAPAAPLLVHLKIDTGLHRNGCLAENWPHLVHEAKNLETEGLVVVEGIWSHLADTSVEEDLRSLDRFNQAVAIARSAGLSPSLLHIAASAAAADLPESRLDMVRIGISAYGVSPFDDRSAEDFGFTPVLSAHAVVNHVDPTTSQFTVAMGYADGLLPVPDQTGWVSYAEHRGDIVSVGPDHTVVLADSLHLPRLGDTVTLFGKPHLGSPRAEDWATWGNTIGDEVLAGIAPHVPRRYINT